MVDIDGLLREGIRRGASDIHLVNQMKPIFRINRELVESKETSEINENDLKDNVLGMVEKLFMTLKEELAF